MTLSVMVARGLTLRRFKITSLMRMRATACRATFRAAVQMATVLSFIALQNERLARRRQGMIPCALPNVIPAFANFPIIGEPLTVAATLCSLEKEMWNVHTQAFRCISAVILHDIERCGGHTTSCKGTNEHFHHAMGVKPVGPTLSV
jgi:hypothetical protein